jgi:CheY-like chemotaxis protein
MGYGDLLMLRHPPGDASHGHLAQIRKSAQRAAGLTQQLLAFSRKQVLQPKVISINEAVREMEGLLRRLIGEHIDIQFALDSGLWLVRADVSQLEQVVMNLAVNSRDAMTRGGRLSISTCNRTVRAEDEQRLAEVAVGEYVQLTVADTGDGMDDATKARIFEPFFTTKRDGKGTGLGLSVVFGVVKQSGGHIFVTSESGKGSTFDILLPRARDDEATAAEAIRPRTSALIPAFGTETVLVVEDDDSVRGFVRDTLSASGYTVIDVADGRKALEIAPHFPRQIDLLLTDVVMPNLGGRELAEQLVKLRPEVKVLYMSGYTEDQTLAHGFSMGSVALLEKPFTARDLLVRVRKVLSS